MQGDLQYFESQVVAYLTADPTIFVSPQYRLTMTEADKANKVAEQLLWPDVVAVRPATPEIFLVEVTTALRPPKKFFDKIERYVREEDLFIARLGHWTEMVPKRVTPWAFVRDSVLPHFKAEIARRKIDSKAIRLTSLENAALPWCYLYVDGRRKSDHGLEPCERHWAKHVGTATPP